MRLLMMERKFGIVSSLLMKQSTFPIMSGTIPEYRTKGTWGLIAFNFKASATPVVPRSMWSERTRETAASLNNSFAEPEIGLVVFNAEDGRLAGLVTHKILPSVCHSNLKDTQTRPLETGQYRSLLDKSHDT